MKLTHASGLYSTKRRFKRRAARQQRSSTRLRTTTEATTGSIFRTRRWAVLRRPGPGARGDCTIEHRRKRWERLSARVVRVSGRYRLGRQCWALVARLRRKDGYRLTVITAHLPASVERQVAYWARGRMVPLDAQGRAWHEAVAGLRRVIEEERERRPGAVIVVTADWNINLRSRVQREYLQRLLGDTVTLARPDRDWDKVPGTHGRRVIDWAACSEMAVVHVLPKTAASDHAPIRVHW